MSSSTNCSLCKSNKICTLYREITLHPEIQVAVASCPYSSEGGAAASPQYSMQDLMAKAATIDPKQVEDRSKKIHEMQKAKEEKAKVMDKMAFLNPHQRQDISSGFQANRENYSSGFIPSVEED